MTDSRSTPGAMAGAATVEEGEVLQSGVLYSPADAMLSQAIAATLAAQPQARATIFEQLTADIVAYVAANFPQRPWSCTLFTGTDGSRIFRGGVGHSLVIDTAGRLWRARSHEDFETTWRMLDGTCEIATLTPLYSHMREYVKRGPE